MFDPNLESTTRGYLDFQITTGSDRREPGTAREATREMMTELKQISEMFLSLDLDSMSEEEFLERFETGNPMGMYLAFSEG